MVIANREMRVGSLSATEPPLAPTGRTPPGSPIRISKAVASPLSVFSAHTLVDRVHMCGPQPPSNPERLRSTTPALILKPPPHDPGGLARVPAAENRFARDLRMLPYPSGKGTPVKQASWFVLAFTSGTRLI